MNPETTFPINLHSGASYGTHPQNKNYCFSNVLAKTYNTDGYEIGLKSISYVDYYAPDPPARPIVKTTTTTTTEQPPAPPGDQPQNNPVSARDPRVQVENTPGFFDIERADNEVVIYFEVENRVVVEKKDETTPETFISNISKALQAGRIKCNINMTIGERGLDTSPALVKFLEYVTIDFNPDDKALKLKIPKPLQEMLGLTYDVVPAGQTKSAKPLKLDIFSQLDVGPVGAFSEFLIEKIPLYLPQMSVEHGKDVFMVAQSIVNTVNLARHHIKLLVDEETEALEFDMFSRYRRVLLSDFLNDYFGFPVKYILQESGTHPLPRSYFQVEEPFVPVNVEKPPYIPAEKILVCCDLVAPSTFGDLQLPIIGILDRKKRDSSRMIAHQNPIIFFPINKSQVDCVRISLYADTGEFISYSDQPTQVELICKKYGYQV